MELYDLVGKWFLLLYGLVGEGPRPVCLRPYSLFALQSLTDVWISNQIDFGCLLIKNDFDRVVYPLSLFYFQIVIP